MTSFNLKPRSNIKKAGPHSRMYHIAGCRNIEKADKQIISLLFFLDFIFFELFEFKVVTLKSVPFKNHFC